MTTPSPTTPPVPPTKAAQQGRRARTDVAIVMTAVVLVSVLIVSVYNFWTASDLLKSTVESQLIGVGESRVTRIESDLEALEAIAASLASGTGMVQSLNDLSHGFQALDEGPSAGEIEELRSVYEANIASAVPPGYEVPPVDAIFPSSDRARYLQYYYIAANPFEDRSNLEDPGDGSEYSAAHASHHPVLRSVAEALEVGDMLLIDAATSSVVYSVDKNIEFGTNLTTGPYSESSLADAVLDQLRFAAAGEAVIVDFEPYVPADFNPTAFVAAAIRDEGRVIGAVAFEIPNEALVEMTTAGMDWEGTGLGETGEVYIVGEDLLMRSDSRLWLEDPDQYVVEGTDEGYSPEVLTAIEAFDTTVLIQPVDTEAVAAGLVGDDYVGVTTNYLGQDTLTVAGPLKVNGLRWVAVTEVTTSEAFGAMRAHSITLLVFIAILILFVIAFAFLISKRILQPIGPIVEAANRIGRGDLDTQLSVSSNDEFGDLASKLGGVVTALQDQAADLRQADADITEMLLAVMPERIVEQFRSGDRDIAEAVRNATMIAIAVDEPDVVQMSEQEEIAGHTVAVSSGIAAIAKQHGVEAVVSTATQYLAVAGLHVDDDEAGRAIRYATAVRDWLEQAAENAGVSITVHIGLAAGDVITGVVGTDRVAFNVWGDPRRRAASLAAVARRGQMLVDPVVAAHAGDEWAVEPILGLVNLDGSELDGWRVVGLKTDVGV
jgi:HAMP domain-containing protein